MAHYPEKVAEYDAAAPRRRTARRIARGAGPVQAPAPSDAPALARLVAPAGFRIAAHSEVPAAGAALVGPGPRRAAGGTLPMAGPGRRAEGWVRGTVARRSRAAG